METIGYILTVAALAPAVLQIKHSLSLRSVAGISGATTLAWVCSWSAWVLYGALVGSGPVIARNVLGLLPAAVLLFVFLRFSKLTAPLLVCGLYLAAAVGLIIDLRIGLLMMVVLDVYFYVPSIVRVFKSSDLSGLSLRSTVSQVFLTSSWVLYLLRTANPISSVGWVVATATYSIITIRVLLCRGSRRKRSRADSHRGQLQVPR